MCRSDLDVSNETIRFQNFHISVESYEEKTSENYRNCYVAENRIISELSKLSIPNLNGINWGFK